MTKIKPDFQTILLPLLQSCADGQGQGLRETIAALATSFQLTEEERKELLPSGFPNVFYIGGYQPAHKWLKDRKERVLGLRRFCIIRKSSLHW